MSNCCDIANYCVISLASSIGALVAAAVTWFKVRGLKNET